ncbi:alpha/beta hydrolase [Hymenobacter latericus]|uniref:alpha/beta hydrolase n=1 Tax=Hymenobacter sp. YIM 151858-1 TaxID=2987688 RepID=UPI002227DCD7|nr:lysophospholipase [Hymenobacter sp. YIM 151858-1]UYZ60977.1 lysophospholipase [Hymenobacter sp. YIM 151858-1]
MYRLVQAALLLFVLVNAVAFNHAWRFTYFSAERGRHTASPEQLSLGDKLWLLATGIRNPKPVGAAAPPFAYRTVYISSPNGRLESWYAPVPQARGTVALFHGYTSDKSRLLREAAYFRHLGYSVLLTDFAGAGGSEGYRITVGHHEADDVAAVVRWLQQQHPGQRVVLYGISMGAVAILRAESELGVQATANIIECPYGSMLQTAQNRFASMGVPVFPMANLLVFWGGVQNGFWAFGLSAEAYAANNKTPTLLMWGTADPRVTRPETDAIFAALGGPKQRHDFEGSGHEPYWRKHPEAWQRAIGAFLRPHLAADGGAKPGSR